MNAHSMVRLETSTSHKVAGARSVSGSFASSTVRVANILASGLAALWLATAPVNAADLSAMQGESINVGGYHGVVYFTAEADGHHVVATFADSGSGTPLRVSTILADQQSATLSVPGSEGEDASSLKLQRFGDKIVIETERAGAERVTAGVVTQ